MRLRIAALQQRLRGSVLTLISGTALSQLVLFAASPLLTRVYTPDAFGQYAMLSFALSLVLVAATGKYELAILLPEKDDDGWALTGLTCLLAVLVTLMGAASACVWVAYTQPQSLMGAEGISRYGLLALASCMVVLGAWQSTLLVWLNRRKQFSAISACRLVQSATMVLSQLALAPITRGLVGLVIGTIVGLLAGLVIQLMAIWPNRRPVPVLDDLWRLARTHSNLPWHSIPTDLIGTILSQFPVYFIGSRFSVAEVGYYSLAQRTLQAPMQIISNSFGEVFRREAAQLVATRGECRSYFLKTARLLGLVASLAVAATVLFAPPLFAWVFSDVWRQAGEFARIMILMYAMKFISSPLSFMFIIARRTRLDLILHSFFLGILLLSFYLAGDRLHQIETALAIFASYYALMYAAYFFISLNLAGRPVVAAQ